MADAYKKELLSWIVLEGRKQKPQREVPGKENPQFKVGSISDTFIAYQLCDLG